MAKPILKFSEYEKNKENPFMKQAVEEIQKHIVKKYKNSTHAQREQRALVAAADLDTGEIFRTSLIRQIEVDDDQFTKLYLSEFKAFFNLSQSAIRVAGYIMQCMKPKKDMIMFILEDCMEYTGFKSKASIYKGLAELVAAEVIARGNHENLFYINPLIIFNGDRVSYTKEFIRKKESEEEQKQLDEAFKDEFQKQLELFGSDEEHSTE